MPDLYMGPNVFRFEQVVVERIVARESGNYALGTKDEGGQFVPKVVGRSDSNLRGELISKLATSKYPYFKFSVASPKSAFELECVQFHLFRSQIENRPHPVRPEGSRLTCFLCGS